MEFTNAHRVSEKAENPLCLFAFGEVEGTGRETMGEEGQTIFWDRRMEVLQ